MRKLNVFLIIAFVLILAVTSLLIWNWTKEIPAELLADADMTASLSDSAGVDVSSVFTVSFDEAVGSAAVQRAVSVEPELTLGFHQGADKNEVLLVPAEPLTPDTLYVFTLNSDGISCTWSFQTATDLLVESTYPVDRTTDYKGNSFDIILNQSLPIDLSLVADYVSIWPELSGSFSQNGRVLTFTADQGFNPGTVYTVNITAGLSLAESASKLAEGMQFSFETAFTEDLSSWTLKQEWSFPSGTVPTFEIAPSDVLSDKLNQPENPAEKDAKNILSAQVYLYKFASAHDYADSLANSMSICAQWSHSWQNLHSCDVSAAEMISNTNVVLKEQGKNYLLSCPAAAKEGYYLLRVYWQGQSRDIYFAVSNISLYAYQHSSSLLFWLHDIKAEESNSYYIEEYFSGSDNKADGSLICLPACNEVSLFIVSNETSDLVIPMWPEAAVQSAELLWRYLYLDKNIYQNGDNISFWGLAHLRDESPLEYERVSVYIYDADGSAVCREYAQLNNNMFSGTLPLPTLLDGKYTLEIWQSGRLLVGREFWIGEPSLAEENSQLPQLSWSNNLQLNSNKAYAYGESFAASFDKGEGEYLFLLSEANVLQPELTDNSLYVNEFVPTSQLDSYIQGVYYSDGAYATSGIRGLYLDYSDRELLLEYSGDNIYQPGQPDSFSISVKDIDGNIPANTQVAVSVICGNSLPKYNALDSIYTDYHNSINFDRVSAASNDYSGDCVFFAVYSPDENGLVQGEFLLDQDYGECYILMQAISNNSSVYAGSAVEFINAVKVPAATTYDVANPDEEDESISVSASNEEGVSDAAEVDAVGGHPVYHHDVAYDVSLGSIYCDGNEQLLVVAANDRIKWLNYLTEVAFISDADQSKPMTLAQTAAWELLRLYLGDLLQADDESKLLLQSVDGSIDSDVKLSVLTALLGMQNISEFALKEYLADNAYFDRIEYCAALAGLAALGEPSLNEINYLLGLDDLSEEEYLWLIMAQYLCHNERPAQNLFAAEEWPQQTSWSKALYIVIAAQLGMEDICSNALKEAQASSADRGDIFLAQVIAAELLLPEQKQGIMSFNYYLNGVEYTGSLSQVSNFCLPLNDFSGLLKFGDMHEGYGYMMLHKSIPE